MALSDWQGIEGLDGLFAAVNTNTDMLFGIVVWVLAYFVLWVVFTSSSSRGGSQAPAMDGFVGSSIVMSLVSILLSAMTQPLFPPYLAAVPIVLSVVGVMVLVKKNG